MRVNFSFFHTVLSPFQLYSCQMQGLGRLPTVRKLRKFTVTLFWQKFRESNVFTKEIARVNLTKYFLVRHCVHSTVWKNEKFTLTQNFSRQINYLVILLVKPLLSRNFCQKRVSFNFRNFHTTVCPSFR